ncbi:MAG: hypothetical protein ABSB42_05480 [Tepidisphaeraceae bacterium]|jgi:hypothetical protein
MNNQIKRWNDYSIEVRVVDPQKWEVEFRDSLWIPAVNLHGHRQSNSTPKPGMVLVIHNGAKLVATLMDAPEPRAGLTRQDYEAKAIEAVDAELAAHA